ncbi:MULTISPECIES: hypothetical protein, partial [Thalassotalea]
MKSKIIFSLFIIFIFLSGLTAGFLGGILNAASPVIGQVWAGAKEMQAAISLIDKNELSRARDLLCNSIQTRLVIMDQLQPVKSETTSNIHKVLEGYLYEDIKKDKPEFRATCI